MPASKQSGFSSYSLENAALGLLMSDSKHGYGLYQEFAKTFERIWKAGQANFYAALTRLEAAGQLQSTAEPQEGRPARKIYEITEEGRDAFLHWIHTPVSSLRAIRVELLAKLRFFYILQLPGALELIDEQIALLRHMIGEWERPVEAQDNVDQDAFHELVDDYRKRQAVFIANWLTDWREHFQKDERTE